MLYFSVPFLLLLQQGQGDLRGKRWTLIPVAHSEGKETGGKTSAGMQLKSPKKRVWQGYGSSTTPALATQLLLQFVVPTL